MQAKNVLFHHHQPTPREIRQYQNKLGIRNQVLQGNIIMARDGKLYKKHVEQPSTPPPEPTDS